MYLNGFFRGNIEQQRRGKRAGKKLIHPGQSLWLGSTAHTGGSNMHVSDDGGEQKSRLDSPYLETREAGPLIV